MFAGQTGTSNFTLPKLAVDPSSTEPLGLCKLQSDPGSSSTELFLKIPPSYKPTSLKRIQGPPGSNPYLFLQSHFPTISGLKTLANKSTENSVFYLCFLGVSLSFQCLTS